MPFKTADELMAWYLNIAKYRHAGSTLMFMGFENDQEEQLFRAVAGSHPKPVLVNEADWRDVAEHLVQGGTLNCIIVKGGRAFKLTDAGKRRAIEAQIIQEAEPQ